MVYSEASPVQVDGLGVADLGRMVAVCRGTLEVTGPAVARHVVGTGVLGRCDISGSPPAVRTCGSEPRWRVMGAAGGLHQRHENVPSREPRRGTKRRFTAAEFDHSLTIHPEDTPHLHHAMNITYSPNLPLSCPESDECSQDPLISVRHILIFFSNLHLVLVCSHRFWFSN